MRKMNLTLLVFGFFLVICLSTVWALDLTMGKRVPGDELLFEYHSFKASKGDKDSREVEEVFYPGPGRITYFEALNQNEKDTFAIASTKDSFGVGLTEVTIVLKSSRMQDLNYIVKIYGFKNPDDPNYTGGASKARLGLVLYFWSLFVFLFCVPNSITTYMI